jgi:hypothetical protein
MRFRTAWIAAAVCLLCAAEALAFDHFNYSCPNNNHISRPAGQDYIFKTPISAVAPGNDQVRVIFEPHVPGSWFTQWCQASTGTCYPDSATITLTAGQPDTLKIYFFTLGDLIPQYGWVNLKIQSIADPLEVAYCTYTLFSGLAVPSSPHIAIDCSDNARQLTVPADVEFFSPIENLSSSPDTLLCTMSTDLPGDWFAQFCQQSTGTCYYDYGEMPLAPNEPDSIWVEVFVGAGPSVGAVDITVQSKRNPSYAQYCHYRVYVGQGTTGVSEVAAVLAQVRVVPNPSSGGISLLLRQPGGGTGSLAIFAADGRMVRDFPALDLRGGTLRLRWDGRGQRSEVLPSGAYFYRFLSGGREARGLLIRSH